MSEHDKKEEINDKYELIPVRGDYLIFSTEPKRKVSEKLREELKQVFTPKVDPFTAFVRKLNAKEYNERKD